MTMQDRFKFRVWDKVSKRYFFLELKFGDNGYHPRFIEKPIFEQATGLRDKNNKLVYENDLIKIGNELYRVAIDDFGCWTVILNNNPFTEVIEWSDIVKTYYFYNREDELEVIGNIHENADILENNDE